MKLGAFIIITITIITSRLTAQQIQIGNQVPDYTFHSVLNRENQPFHLRDREKPLIIEFWATWCMPCITAMNKLEAYQKKYEGEIDVVAVSSEPKENLMRFIEQSNPQLRIAWDTTHTQYFTYKIIPHSILIDKSGQIMAIMNPLELTDENIQALIEGREIVVKRREQEEATNLQLNVSYTGKDYQYNLTSENRRYGFKNEIKRDEFDTPVFLDFRNVSLYRLLADIYELSSVARIYTEDEISMSNKYCFQLYQNKNYPKSLLENAKEILNANLEVYAEIVEKELDSIYVLERVEGVSLVKESKELVKYYEFRGPYFKGRKITSYNLIEYLENEVQQPIKDKSNLNYCFDMDLNWNYGDGKSLNKELEKYGLVIKRSSKPEKIKLLWVKAKNQTVKP